MNQRARSTPGVRGVVNAAQWCFTRLDLFLHHATGWSIGAAVAHAPQLVLITTGRRTGKTRRTPLVYVPYKESFLVVAAYGGSPWNPHWLANLRSFSRASIEVEHGRIDVEAQVVEGDRRADLWPMMCEQIASLHSAQGRTDREIPLVQLTPVGPSRTARNAVDSGSRDLATSRCNSRRLDLVRWWKLGPHMAPLAQVDQETFQLGSPQSFVVHQSRRQEPVKLR